MIALAVIGWLLALLLGARVLVLARRLELVAMAEHELRGPLAALSLAAEALARRPSRRAATALESQLERARLGLSDLAAARAGRRTPPDARRLEARAVAVRATAGWRATGANVRFNWRAGRVAVHADGARLSQALGNLLSNAIEHGGGEVELRGVRADGRLRIELTDTGPGFAGPPAPGRGRGLAIAARAVEEAGGTLQIASGEGGSTVAVELPLADGA
ncbi:MAG TPA: sensor histidine kinase [Thermoleophilaceae bacterium]|nr:sensor histidine kinase [Thermoleophilaceae bacterium]